MSDSTEPAAPGRRLPFDGAVNFRDIGGYRARDGRVVRSHRVFRSDSLAELTSGDLARIGALELSTICDLRHETERSAKPNRFPASAEPTTKAIGFLAHRAYEMVAAAHGADADPEVLREDIREAYRHFVREQADTYRTMFELLLDADNLPMLVHCTSGKDRTGIAIALILMALDVPDETIREDYMLSNIYRRDLAYMGGGSIRPEMLSVMMEVDPSFLAAAWSAIDEDWASRDDFLTERLGLTAERRLALRSMLLIAPNESPEPL